MTASLKNVANIGNRSPNPSKSSGHASLWIILMYLEYFLRQRNTGYNKTDFSTILLLLMNGQISGIRSKSPTGQDESPQMMQKARARAQEKKCHLSWQRNTKRKSGSGMRELLQKH